MTPDEFFSDEQMTQDEAFSVGQRRPGDFFFSSSIHPKQSMIVITPPNMQGGESNGKSVKIIKRPVKVGAVEIGNRSI